MPKVINSLVKQNVAQQGVARERKQEREDRDKALAGTNREFKAIMAPISGTTKVDAVNELNNRIANAQNALLEYEASGDSIYIRDSEQGILYKIAGTDKQGQPIYEPDVVGTKKFQNFLAAQEQLGTFMDGLGNQLDTSGGSGGAAFDYLGAERNRVAEADRQFGNYMDRVVSVADLEAAEGAKFRQGMEDVIAGTEREANTGASRVLNPGLPFGGQVITRPGVAPTDLTQYSNAIKETIPNEVPALANIDPNAFMNPRIGGGPGPAAGNVSYPPPGMIPIGGPSAPNQVAQNVVDRVGGSQVLPPTLSNFLRKFGVR